MMKTRNEKEAWLQTPPDHPRLHPLHVLPCPTSCLLLQTVFPGLRLLAERQEDLEAIYRAIFATLQQQYSVTMEMVTKMEESGGEERKVICWGALGYICCHT